MMREAGLKIHPDKCTFASPDIVYQGHVISEKVVQANSEKIADVQNWPKIRTASKGCHAFSRVLWIYQETY